MCVGERWRRGSVPAVMTGPLAAYGSELRTEFARLGYAASSVGDAVRTLTRLSGWMGQRGLAAAELTPSVVKEFLAARRQVCCSEPVARRSLGAVLRVLRASGVVPRGEPAGDTSVDALLADYRGYLFGERGLAAESVRCYGAGARRFLALLPEPLDEALAGLDTAHCRAVSWVHPPATSARDHARGPFGNEQPLVSSSTLSTGESGAMRRVVRSTTVGRPGAARAPRHGEPQGPLQLVAAARGVFG